MASTVKENRQPNFSTKIAYLMITTTVLLWAISVVIGRGVHDEIPLIGLNFWRWIIAVVFLTPFVWREVWENIEIIRKTFQSHFCDKPGPPSSVVCLLNQTE